MPVLRLDPAPPVDFSLVDWSFQRRRGADIAADSNQQPHRQQPVADTTSSGALVALETGTLSVSHARVSGLSASSSALVIVNNDAIRAAERSLEQRLSDPGSQVSSASEVAAFRQSFNKARPGQRLFRQEAEPYSDNSITPSQPIEPKSTAQGSSVVSTQAQPAPSKRDDSQLPDVRVVIEDKRDHLGRSFMHYSALNHPAPSRRAGSVPGRLIHAYKGHNAGVQVMEIIPNTHHLLLSADLSGCVMLWDLLGDKRRVATYRGHASGVRSLTFSSDGSKFSSAGLDRIVREWDTETGNVLNTLRYGPQGSEEVVMAHSYDPRRAHIILAGAGKKIVQWDTRASPSRVVREYEAHTGSIMHVGFLRGGHHFASSSEDKTFRTWDIDSSVTVQDFADAAMHAVPHFAVDPESAVIAAQSLDNRINFFAPLKAPGKFKIIKDKFCGGHAVSGSTCRVAFSPDGRYVSSGSVNGELYIWDRESCQVVKSFKAHSKVLNAHLWHPTSPWVVTSGWDGSVKIFAA